MDAAHTTTPHSPDPEQLRAASEAAVAAVSTAYTRDASVDVADRLRAEMARAGFPLDDEAWVREVARSIRSGHSLTFEPEAAGVVPDGEVEAGDPQDAVGPTSAGSLGGDNGGA